MFDISGVVQVVGPIVALGTLIAGIVQYLNVRERDLSWKRTEFIFSQCQYAENDVELREITEVLAGRSDVSIETVLSDSESLSMAERRRLQRGLEKFLGLLDRLAYAVDHGKSLTVSEIAEFGWHFRVVSQTPELLTYAKTSYYPCLLAMAPKLQSFIDTTWPRAALVSPTPAAQVENVSKEKA